MVSVVSIIVILVGCQLVVAQGQVCSKFCSSLGKLKSSPGKSCSNIYQTNKASQGVSGLYWISAAKGTKQVYCDMELECDGVKGGWMRIADVNTSRGDACPTGWTQVTTPGTNGIKVCNRASTSNFVCSSISLSVQGTSYQKMCGQVKGYQKGETNGFYNYKSAGQKSISSAYVDGVSITTGSPRQHVWTYAAGRSDDYNYASFNCPCAVYPGQDAPMFVGNYYYCESGDTGSFSRSPYYLNDPLWDGDGCTGTNNNCCTSAGMPWFSRRFPTSQQEDVEVRICSIYPLSYGAVLVEVVQLFVQ